MPKRIFKIPGFNGGLNEADDPRDIADNQASEIENIDITRPG